MANIVNRKNNRIIKLIWFIVISFAMVAFAIYEISSKDVSFNDEKKLTRYIKSEEELIELASGAYNDTLILDKDIEITQNISLSSEINPFKGSFDGNGFTITIKNTDCSLFEEIAESGVVKNVKIEYSNENLETDSFAIITNENNGTIENVYIVCKNTYISTTSKFGLIAINNNGKIKDCVIDYAITKSVTEEIVKNYFGGVCINNNGEITNILTKASFIGFEETDAIKVAENKKINDNIGAIIVNNKSTGTVSNCFVEGDNDLFTCDKYISSSIVDILFNISIIEQFMIMDFDEDIWVLNNGIITMKSGDIK